MADDVRTLALFMESNSAQFDTDSLYELLNEISDGVVWNFITGAYVFKTAMTPIDLSKRLNEDAYPTHVVLEFDPASASGVLQREAWESWFGDLFFDDRDRISAAKGWDPKIITAIRNKKAK